MVSEVIQASALLDMRIRSHDDLAPIFRTGIPLLEKDLPGLFTRGHIHCISVYPKRSLSHEVIASYLQDIAEQKLRGKVFIIAPPEQGGSTIQRIYGVLKSRVTEQSSIRRIGTTASEKKPLSNAKELLSNVLLMQYLDITGLIESVGEIAEAHESGVVLVVGLNSLITNTQRAIGAVQTAAAVTSVLQGLRKTGDLCMHLIELELGWLNTNGNTQFDAAGSASLTTAFASGTAKSLSINLSPMMERTVLAEVDVVIAFHDGDGKLHSQHASSIIVEVVKDERLLDDCVLGAWSIWT